jgi:hypothetical protein
MQQSVVSLIIHDIRCINRSFSEFTFIYANKTCNRVAHECARQVSHEIDRVEWHLDLPDLGSDQCHLSIRSRSFLTPSSAASTFPAPPFHAIRSGRGATLLPSTRLPHELLRPTLLLWRRQALSHGRHLRPDLEPPSDPSAVARP